MNKNKVIAIVIGLSILLATGCASQSKLENIHKQAVNDADTTMEQVDSEKREKESLVLNDSILMDGQPSNEPEEDLNKEKDVIPLAEETPQVEKKPEVENKPIVEKKPEVENKPIVEKKPTPKVEPKPLPDPLTYSLKDVDTTLIYRTTASLNLRVGPSTQYDKMATLSSGIAVEPIGKYEEWYKIKSAGKEGFVHGDYIVVKTKEADKVVTPPKDTTPSVKATYIQGVLIVNKGYGLPSSYAPGENGEASSAYHAMRKAAANDGHSIKAYSTYRSYDYQKGLYNRYVAKDGKKNADTYSARPGHSEHQTGLAFDIGWAGMYYSSTMGDTKEGKWMAENSYKYGFILRYPKGKSHITGYQYEPWHFRYLGKDMAEKVYHSGLTLDEYLGAVAPNYQ